MAWLVFNGILVVVAFAGILGVMIAGFRWQARCERDDQLARAEQRRRLEASRAAEAGGGMDAELAAIVERFALTAVGSSRES